MTSTVAATTAEQVAALSRWINTGPTYAGLDFETRGWRRLAKVTEENGEVTEAWLGTIGENQRKGKHKSLDDVTYELLDVATCALGAIENLLGDDGTALSRLTSRHAPSDPDTSDDEAATWRLLGRITDLAGRVTLTWLDLIAEHRRTGVWASPDLVLDGLLDLAAAALDTVEHVSATPGRAYTQLAEHVAYVYCRAGLSL